MYLLLLKFASIRVLLSQPFLKYFLVVVGLVAGVKVFVAMFHEHRIVQMSSTGIFLLFIFWYFGLLPSFALFSVLFASHCIGKRIFYFDKLFLQLSIGFFMLLQLYVTISMVFRPSIALWVVVILSCGMTVYEAFVSKMFSRKVLLAVMQKLPIQISALSVVELVIIVLAFVYGSFPQSSFNWDSVYANLYNAKWYIQLDSLKPIEESISSFFPQHAVLYYSLFYAIGGFRMVQIAYLLPLFLLLGLMHELFQKQQVKTWFLWCTRLLIFSPIVFMQTTSGYYDLLIATLMVLSVYVVCFEKRGTVATRMFAGTLFLSIANASKIFPLALSPILLVTFIDSRTRVFFRGWSATKMALFSVLCVVVLLAPLAGWMWRSYVYTESPIFPLFQNVFPTPKLWSSANSVNENRMTQTTMSVSSWLAGGFAFYPILTYFRTDQFLEATRGFPGFIYILLLPIQAWCLAVMVVRLWKKKLILHDLALFVSFIGMLAVGFVTRYYRYIWPFQFTFALYSFVYMKKYMHRFKISIWALVCVIIFLYTMQSIDLAESMRFSPPPQKRQLLFPDAFLVRPQDAIWDYLKAHQLGKPTLDASQNALPRVYLFDRSYQCNWYWVSGDKKIAAALAGGDENIAQFMRKFSYVIVSSDPEYTGTYCDAIIRRYPHLQFVVKNGSYALYAVQ